MSLSEPGRESVIKAIQGNPDNPVRFVTCRILNDPQITVFKILAILSDSFWQKIRYLVSTYLPTYLPTITTGGSNTVPMDGWSPVLLVKDSITLRHTNNILFCLVEFELVKL